jgi:hypothetical protein
MRLLRGFFCCLVTTEYKSLPGLAQLVTLCRWCLKKAKTVKLVTSLTVLSPAEPV